MPRRWKRGKGPTTRGRHKRERSAETRRWNRLFDPRKKRDESPPEAE
jgi:hypothetical protein